MARMPCTTVVFNGSASSPPNSDVSRISIASSTRNRSDPSGSRNRRPPRGFTCPSIPIVDASLQVEGVPCAWAAGDAAAIPSPEGLAPPTAQHAVREGKLLARNILAVLEGRPPQPFTYRTKGQLVSLGHRSGVGIVMGILVRGFPAWWLWRTYYLMQLPTWLRRVRVALDWTIDLFFQKDVVELPMGSERREA